MNFDDPQMVVGYYIFKVIVKYSNNCKISICELLVLDRSVIIQGSHISHGRWMQNIGLPNVWRPSYKEWIKISMIYWIMVLILQQRHVDFSTVYEHNIIDIVIYLFGNIGITTIQ